MLRDAGNRYIRSVLSTLSMHSGWRDRNSLLGYATYASYATTFAQNAARKGQIRIRGDKKKMSARISGPVPRWYPVRLACKMQGGFRSVNPITSGAIRRGQQGVHLRP